MPKIGAATKRFSILEIGMHATTDGGLDRFYHGLVSELARMGMPHRGLVFGERLDNSGFIDSLGSITLSAPCRLWRIRKEAGAYLREQHTRCVIATHFALYAFPVLDLLKRHPHVVHFHGPWSSESAVEGRSRWVVRAKRQMERAVYQSAQRLIVLSAAFRELLVRQFAVDREKIEVIPGGIDADAFSPQCSPSEARERLGWPKDRQIVICVRRLVQRMGLEPLIEAMETVRRHHSDALLLIAGKGPLSERLSAQIAVSRLSDHVRLLGFVSDADLPLAYRAADLSIVPSQALEGFGLITLESLAAGTPVLVTPVGGLPETVQGLNDRLILPGTASADLADGLISALGGALALPSEADCRAYVRRGFDWSVIAPRVVDVYRRVRAR